MEQTEQKLIIEGEIVSLKREHKYALDTLGRVKADTAEIIGVKERVTKEIEARQLELTKVLEDISQEKLKWAIDKQGQLDEIANMKSEAQNVLNRKAELNKQEEDIRQIEAKNTDVLNETRRLELKLEGDKTALKVEKKEIQEEKTAIKTEKVELKKEIQSFKEKLVKVLEEANHI